MITYYRKENALLIPHIKLIRLFLWTLGLWPGEEFGEKPSVLHRFWRKAMFCESLFYILGQVVYLCKFSKQLTFSFLGQSVILLFLNIETQVSRYNKQVFGTT